MKVYVPLTKDDHTLIAKTEEVDIRDWRDIRYLRFFESELEDSHEGAIASVTVEGSEFLNCKIYVPKNESDYDAYIVTDEDFVPRKIRDATESVDSGTPSVKWVQRWLEKSKYSENFYHSYSLDLSTKYVSPQVLWEDDSYSNVVHPNSIRKGSRVLVLGQPGAGKTSFARYLTQTYLSESRNRFNKNDSSLVFYFQLRDFSQKASEFSAWLASEEDEVGQGYVVRKGDTGKILYVFDGLDELNEIDRDYFREWLTKFVETRPSASTIVTSRELNSLDSGIWRTFRKARVLPFDRTRTREYCELFLEDREKTKSFLSALDTNPDLQEFLRNPFSLSLALGMYMLRGSLPFNVGVLCKEIVAQLVERWDARRGIRRASDLSAESVNSTLGRLAYRLQENQDAQFIPEILEDILPFELERFGAKAVLRDLSERTGLISEVAPGTWAFGHRYLQDFFCANYMIERASGLDVELEKYGSDTDWVDVWRQAGQLCQDPEFFALERSRRVSGGIKSIDRMVSSLLSHEGLSKSELRSIIIGIVDEIGRDAANLPRLVRTDFGIELDCNNIDEQSILILAKIIMHLSYLRQSAAGKSLLDCLSNGERGQFSEAVKEILLSEMTVNPIIGTSSVQVHFE